MSRVDQLIAEHCPDGVPFEPVAEVFETRTGYTPSKADPANWRAGTVPWFRMDDIRTNGRILFDSLQHVSEKAVKRGGTYPADSIVMSTLATIGEHALIKVPFLANQQLTILSVKPAYAERIDPKFAYYYCFKLGEWCRKNTKTASVPSVDMAGFKRFRFPLPPLEVQREIVEILDQFASLEAELESELDARRRQHEHYRRILLAFAEVPND